MFPDSAIARGLTVKASTKLTSEEEASKSALKRKAHWKRWGPYWVANVPGARCAKTTVRTDMPGSICLTITPVPSTLERRRNRRCLRHQHICFAVALWNEQDPILKERMFGLTGNEGNHGEDVKRILLLPRQHAYVPYMKYLYKYQRKRSSRTRNLWTRTGDARRERSRVRAYRHRC